MAILGGHATAAREQYLALESQRGLMLVLGGMSNDRLLGLLAQTMDNLDQATIHFEDALAFCRKSGYRPELAWSCCDYADALLVRNCPGDSPKAKALLGESLTISSELGMRPLMEKVEARLAGLPDRVSRTRIPQRPVPPGGGGAAPHSRRQDRPGDC